MQPVDNSANSLESLESLAQEAIAAALNCNWSHAQKINEKLLSRDEGNVEALNRLARAQACLGFIPKALKTYKKVLLVDPFNIIALKNIDKLSKSNGTFLVPQNGMGSNGQNSPINISKVFLDEPGRTKLVNLLNLAPPAILAGLNCGDKLEINPKNHSISVCLENGTYLGAFPDDLAHRLISFIAGGNKYEAYVRSNTTKSLTVFVREVLRSEKFGNQPTFQTKVSFFDEEPKP